MTRTRLRHAVGAPPGCWVRLAALAVGAGAFTAVAAGLRDPAVWVVAAAWTSATVWAGTVIGRGD